MDRIVHGAVSTQVWQAWVWRVALFAGAMMVGAGLLAGCRDRSGDAADGKPVVVASIHPLADLVRQLLGDEFEVHTLLPAGSSPHGFELKPDQLRMLARADALVTVGMGMDPWAERAMLRSSRPIELLRMSQMLNVDSTSSSDAHHHHHDDDDHDHDHHADMPNGHLWLDPVVVHGFVEELGAHLAGRYPEHAEAIGQRMAETLAAIHEVDHAYREQLADVKRKQLVTFHNAFDLLAERYGLAVTAHLTPIELNPGGEVTPSRLRRAVDQVREHNLAVIYAEPQFPDQAVTFIQRETGVAILRLDPLGDPHTAGYTTWQEMMLSNLAVLVDGQNR